MNHLKLPGLVALAAAGLMAFTGVASATTLTSPKGTTYTGTVQATSTPLKFEGSFITVECQPMTIDGAVESHGAATTAGFKIQFATGFIPCSFSFTVLRMGSLEIHTDSEAADGNGRVTWSGFEFTIHTSVGTCTFAANKTDVGTLTGSDTGKAVWNLNSTSIPKTAGSFFCGTAVTMTGSYTFTTPSTLSVD